MQKAKYYLTASLLNSWLGQYDSFYDMLYRRETEPNEKMQAGIDFEERAIKGEIEELKPYVDGALYQAFVCKECEGYMLLGFCDLVNQDTIYDLKYVSQYEIGKYNNSVQHLIYLYCTDMDKFEYIIGCKDELYFEKQPRDDNRLKSVVKQFISWLKRNNLMEVYEQNYSVERYREQIDNYLNW